MKVHLAPSNPFFCFYWVIHPIVGSGACDVHVDGFSDTVHRTGPENSEFGFMGSILAQSKWRDAFDGEKTRLDDIHKKTIAASKEKDLDVRADLLREIGDVHQGAVLPAPVGWPCSTDDDDDASGLPKLSIMMQVHFHCHYDHLYSFI
jgi:hypothetical protein